MEVRALNKEEWKDAMGLAWRTFLKFEAPDYSEEGITNFYKFITDETLKKMFLLGEYKAYGAFLEGKLIGVAGVRGGNHISLLFVEKEFHHQGVATKILQHIFQYLHNELGAERVTVNSSPYAVGFYHKTGFHDTDMEQTADGIRFTPMSRVL